jgi:hypothetical protein
MSIDNKRDGSQSRFGLGLHRPYFTAVTYQNSDPATIARKQQDVTEALRQYLRREAIPDQLVEEMIRRSSRGSLAWHYTDTSLERRDD